MFVLCGLLIITAVNCGSLDNPVNGVVTIDTGTTLGMIARYSCNPGYLLMEALALRLCTISGQWSGTAPTCERMSYMMPYLDSIMDTIYIACKVICCLLLLSPIRLSPLFPSLSLPFPNLPLFLLKQLTVVPYQIH